MKLKRNMNRFDQVLRLGVGIVTIYIGFIDSSLIAEPLISACIGIFGIINLFSVATGHCPIYHMAGISTVVEEET